MRIIVTGGSGFIGTNFIELLLEKGHNSFINIDKNKPINSNQNQYWKYCNILNYNEIEQILNEFQECV